MAFRRSLKLRRQSSRTRLRGSRTPPLSPESVSIEYVPATQSLDLSWDAPSSGVTPSSYYVKRSDVAGGPYTVIATPTGTTYSDTLIPYEKKRYYYVISAVAGGLEGDDSTEVSDVCYFATQFVLLNHAAGQLVALASIDNVDYPITTLRDFDNGAGVQDISYSYYDDWAIISENVFDLLSFWQFSWGSPLFGEFLHNPLNAPWSVAHYDNHIWYAQRNSSTSGIFRQDKYSDLSGTAQTFTSGIAECRSIFIDRTNEKIYFGFSGGRILKREALDGSGAFVNVNGTSAIGTPTSINTLVYDHINGKLIYGDGGNTIYRKNADGSGSEDSLNLGISITSMDIDFASNELLAGQTNGWTRVDLSTFTEVSGAEVSSLASVTDVRSIGTNINLIVTPTLIAGNGKVYVDLLSIIKIDTASIEIKRSTTEDGSYSTVGTISTPRTHKVYIDSTVTNGTQYWYKVIITDLAGNVYPLSNAASITPQNVDAIVSTNLVAEFKFDEGSGAVVNDNVGSDNGTINGTYSWNSKGLVFGTNVNVAWGHTIGGVGFDYTFAREPSNSFTHLIAYKSSSSTAGTIFSKAKSGTVGQRQYQLSIATDDLIVRLGGVTTTTDLNQSTHEKVIQITYDAARNEVRLYVDSLLIYINEGAATESEPLNCYLGMFNGASDAFAGTIYYMAVYDRSLTPAEAAKNYNELYEILGDRAITLADPKL